MGCLAFVVVFGFLWLNLRQAARNNAALRVKDWPWGPGLALRYDADARAQAELFSKLFKPALVLVSAFIAVLFAVSLSAQWDTYLRFRYGDAFGVVDPLYGVDVGFYVFHLPFYEMLQYSLTTLLVVTLRLI